MMPRGRAAVGIKRLFLASEISVRRKVFFHTAATSPRLRRFVTLPVDFATQLLVRHGCQYRRPALAAVRTSQAGTSHEATMRIFSVWVFEFLKLIGRRPLYPLNAECPFCQQMVRLHYNKAGRRHLFAHARAYSRALYEGYHYGAHYSARMKCLGSGTLATFDPRPNEKQHFGTPKSL
jgi:hypothetical protein